MIAIYARQSIERPDSVSIETQVDQCRSFAAGESRVYADAGYSGKNINRPEFERMIREIKDGKITAVISYRLDRVSRNIIDFANLLSMFEQYGVKYISATEQFDTSTPMGRAMIYIVMVFAQLERETIATRISDNYRFRAARGLFMGGNAPFGYDSRRVTEAGKKISVLEPNDQAGILKRIFDMCSSRESLVSICHELNQEGIKTAKGNLWSSGSVKRVLRNISPCRADETIYEYLVTCGYHVSNGLDEFDGQHGMCLFFKNKNRNQPAEISSQVAVIGLHKPLISSAQYIHVQNILNANTPVRGKRSDRTFLAGLVKCKECGHSFGVKYTAKGGREYAYYRCRGRESRGVCGNNIYIPADEIETLIVQRCRSHLAQIGSSEKKVSVRDPFPAASEVEQLNEQIQNLIDNIGKGNSVVNDLLTKKITSLQKQIDTISSSARTPEVSSEIDAKTVKWLAGQLDRFPELTIPQKTDVMRNIVKTIAIGRNGEIEIDYLF
ncbi:MAG: recombinase family protein [Intestinimonas sp.]|nr:recombinase family protein [Intestinimonas sp.]